MDNNEAFQFSLNFDGEHYEGMITPSEEKGKDGTPVYFRVMIDKTLFAYLCCADNGWREKEGNSQSPELVNAIGEYIREYYK